MWNSIYPLLAFMVIPLPPPLECQDYADLTVVCICILLVVFADAEHTFIGWLTIFQPLFFFAGTCDVGVGVVCMCAYACWSGEAHVCIQVCVEGVPPGSLVPRAHQFN